MQNGKTLPTTVPLNLYLIFVEDIVVFLSLKVLSTDNYAFFPLVEKPKSHIVEKPQSKINTFSNYKH